MKTVIKKCGLGRSCYRALIQNHVRNEDVLMMREKIAHSVFAPRCDHEYDEIDREYRICSRCGYDAEKQITRPGNRRRSISRYGIDPDVRLDDWD